MAETLDELYQEIKDCNKCDLCKGRTQVVFGVGSSESDLLFIGEAPGRNEDQQGEPFVGAAGKLLNKLLQSIELSRQDIYIANVLKCRPPNNRDPQPEEIDACKNHLAEQIKIIKPKIIAPLGKFASSWLLGKNVSMSKVHGKKFAAKNFFIFPVYHPAAALYARTTLVDLEKDFGELKKMLDEGIEPPPKDPIQASLF